MSRDLGARYPREREHAAPGFVKGAAGVLLALPDLRPRKEDAPCCVARRDDLGRLPIGFCSPSCVRRPKAHR